MSVLSLIIIKTSYAPISLKIKLMVAQQNQGIKQSHYNNTHVVDRWMKFLGSLKKDRQH